MSDFMQRLRRNTEDRGFMADLRCYLVPSKRHRAWPALARIGIDSLDETSALVAALYALHPLESNKGNFGWTCRQIGRERDGLRSDDARLSPTERRMQHLLAAEYGEELRGRIMRMVMAAKSAGVPVNFEKLHTDVKYWGDRTRMSWASSFWSGTEEKEETQ